MTSKGAPVRSGEVPRASENSALGGRARNAAAKGQGSAMTRKQRNSKQLPPSRKSAPPVASPGLSADEVRAIVRQELRVIVREELRTVRTRPGLTHTAQQEVVEIFRRHLRSTEERVKQTILSELPRVVGNAVWEQLKAFWPREDDHDPLDDDAPAALPPIQPETWVDVDPTEAIELWHVSSGTKVRRVRRNAHGWLDVDVAERPKPDTLPEPTGYGLGVYTAASSKFSQDILFKDALRVLRVLACLYDEKDLVTFLFPDLSRCTRMHSLDLRRALDCLLEHGWIIQLPRQKNYGLGARYRLAIPTGGSSA
jgi:uncharacterized protein YoaH (UPF0181 family)